MEAGVGAFYTRTSVVRFCIFRYFVQCCVSSTSGGTHRWISIISHSLGEIAVSAYMAVSQDEQSALWTLSWALMTQVRAHPTQTQGIESMCGEPASGTRYPNLYLHPPIDIPKGRVSQAAPSASSVVIHPTPSSASNTANTLPVPRKFPSQNLVACHPPQPSSVRSRLSQCNARRRSQLSLNWFYNLGFVQWLSR